MIKEISGAVRHGRNLLEHEAMALLARYGIPTPKHKFAGSLEEACAAACGIGFPVVLKIVSKDILHKTEAGGVRLGIRSEEALAAGYAEMMENMKERFPDAEIEGVLVVEQVGKGIECIAGMVRDEQFGPALMFGLGGILVELLEDVAFSLLPVDAAEAREMIESVKGFKLLKGYRGQPPRDLEAVTDLIVRIGKLTEENPEIKEIDINPFFVYEKGVMPVDIRIII